MSNSQNIQHPVPSPSGKGEKVGEGTIARATGLLKRLVHDPNGPLTRELLLNPSAFGLPSRVDAHAADAVVKSVCGFCSTGCNLNIHMQNGEAVSLSPATHYPVNLGMACPKGWQALDVLDAPDRAVLPLLGEALAPNTLLGLGCVTGGLLLGLRAAVPLAVPRTRPA